MRNLNDLQCCLRTLKLSDIQSRLLDRSLKSRASRLLEAECAVAGLVEVGDEADVAEFGDVCSEAEVHVSEGPRVGDVEAE